MLIGQKRTIMEYLRRYPSPLGGITLTSDGAALTGLRFDDQPIPFPPMENGLPIFQQADRWLDLYFSGRIPDGTPALSPRGTAFQRLIWDLLVSIPYGQTVTYGEIAARAAARMGVSRMSAQAVGGAVGRNPIALMIPCHRVIGRGGRLTGYAYGLDRKRALLSLEGILSQ